MPAGLGAVSMLKDLGVDISENNKIGHAGLEVPVDASAGGGVALRREADRIRHLVAPTLVVNGSPLLQETRKAHLRLSSCEHQSFCSSSRQHDQKVVQFSCDVADQPLIVCHQRGFQVIDGCCFVSVGLDVVVVSAGHSDSDDSKNKVTAVWKQGSAAQVMAVHEGGAPSRKRSSAWKSWRKSSWTASAGPWRRF